MPKSFPQKIRVFHKKGFTETHLSKNDFRPLLTSSHISSLKIKFAGYPENAKREPT